MVACGAGDGGGGAAGGVGESVGFFAGAAVVGRFGSDHVEGLGVESTLEGKVSLGIGRMEVKVESTYILLWLRGTALTVAKKLHHS